MLDRPGRDSSSSAGGYISGKMAHDLSPRKTMVVLVIVVGCFAVLWPKVFYPMLLGSANTHIKPSPIDRTKGCCDVISETDVHTLKIMSHICSTIIKPDRYDMPLSDQALISECRSIVLDVCGIDLSAVLHQQIRLGQTSRQILDQVRSLNGSLCLKYNFGVAPWSLGVPHRVTVKVSPSSIKQERPLHLRSEMVHPAFRERGRAIPQSQPQEKPAAPSKLIPKVIVPGRPGPIPGMRRTIGGAGHVAPKQGTGSMGLIMPIYTIGIIIFFSYTVMKVLFKKQPESLYPSVDADATFRREVFDSAKTHSRPRAEKDGASRKLVVNAMSALLDEVDQELSARHKASEVTDQDIVANGKIVREDDHASVKVLGMETTASCEGGKKWSRPDSPALPAHPQSTEPVEPPQEIFLEGSLPPQSHLLVTDSATEAQNLNSEEDPAVVLAGKMTLSVISLDSCDNLTDESSNGGKQGERSSSNASEDFEKIEVDSQLGQIKDVIEEAQNISVTQSLLDEIRDEINQSEENSGPKNSDQMKGAQELCNENEQKVQFESPITAALSTIEAQQVETEELKQKTNESKQELEKSADKIPETFTKNEIQSEMTLRKNESEQKREDNDQLPEQDEMINTAVDEMNPEEFVNKEETQANNNESLTDFYSDSPSSPSQEIVEEGTEPNQKPIEANGEDAANSESEDEVEEVEEDEEIEYEYEESDNDEVDEELRNVERMSEQNEERYERMNGEGFDHSKNGTISNVDLAENEASGEENSESEDSEEEIIEEIIEYVTDEDDIGSVRNNANHVDDN